MCRGEELAMNVVEVTEGIYAFIRPDEGANATLLRTGQRKVVVDTTSSAADMRGLLSAVDACPTDVGLVINTHQHSDHTWGNQLFDCPILAHRLCREAMAANLKDAWRLDRIRASIAERSETDPRWAEEMRQKIAGLEITLPSEVFDQERDIDVGGLHVHVEHVGGHSPGSSVVWLPGQRVLLSGDLLFVGRYPFIGDADIPALIEALRRIRAFEAQAIVPGHGPMCDNGAIQGMLYYIQGTWERTIDHIAQGHTVDEAAADQGYPRYAEGAAERYHENNIRVVYAQLMGGDACPL
jgi:cyclase